MDTKRFILYVILGLICFAIWNAWQKDYHPILTAQANKNESISKVAAKQSDAAALQLTPSVAAGETSSSEETKVSSSQTSTAKIPESRLIKVHTDVLEIAIDKNGGDIVQSKLLKYPVLLHEPEPVQLLSDDPDNLYLAKSSLVSAVGPDTKNIPAKYIAAQNNYFFKPDQNELEVKLQWKDNQGVMVDKIFTFKRGHYDIKVSYDISNNSKKVWNGYFYGGLERKNVKGAKGRFAYRAFEGAAISSAEKTYEKISYKRLAEENLDREINGGWLALQQRYFLSAFVPEKDKPYHYFSSVEDGDIYNLGLKSKNISLPAGAKDTISATLYTGPEIAKNLAAIAPGLERTIDYGWLWIISEFLFWVMQQIYKIVGNWGWAIIFVTLLIKIAFFKLSESSYRSMAHMKDLAPKMKALKERYSGDRQKLSQATMELYRKEKINPLGGCLPMLVQIPVFIGLYYVLIEAVELRQAPFMLWIHDLSVKDPYYILPILMGLSMFLQQKLSPQSPDPAQAKMMLFLPVIFTFFFLSFPSGLVLYWLVNNCLSILQQWYINKKHIVASVKVAHGSHQK